MWGELALPAKRRRCWRGCAGRRWRRRRCARWWARWGRRWPASRRRRQAAACAPPQPAHGPGAGGAGAGSAEVELDGAWVHSHDNAHGLEVKVGVVHAGSVRVGAHPPRAWWSATYAATARGVAPSVPSLTAVIEARNGFAATVQELFGDGASVDLAAGRRRCCPEATRVLDRWHLTDARRRALRAALPDKARPGPVECAAGGAVGGGRRGRGRWRCWRRWPAVAPHPALTEFAGYVTTLAPCHPQLRRAPRRRAAHRQRRHREGRRRGRQPPPEGSARHALVAGAGRGPGRPARGPPQ